MPIETSDGQANLRIFLDSLAQNDLRRSAWAAFMELIPRANAASAIEIMASEGGLDFIRSYAIFIKRERVRLGVEDRLLDSAASASDHGEASATGHGPVDASDNAAPRPSSFRVSSNINGGELSFTELLPVASCDSRPRPTSWQGNATARKYARHYKMSASLLPRHIDFEDDLARWVTGRHAQDLVPRMIPPTLVFGILFTLPAFCLRTYLLPDANWALALHAAGFTAVIPLVLVLIGSLNRPLASEVRSGNTFYIWFSALLYIGSKAHYDFYRHPLYGFLGNMPHYAASLGIYFYSGLPDAMHPRIKQTMFRVVAPIFVLGFAANAAMLRMPGAAAEDEAHKTWWVLGVETVTANCEMLTNC